MKYEPTEEDTTIRNAVVRLLIKELGVVDELPTPRQHARLCVIVGSILVDAMRSQGQTIVNITGLVTAIWKGRTN